ncbi:MAG: hypothetical protein AAFX54_15255 [Pseudomonadota bacterium]
MKKFGISTLIFQAIGWLFLVYLIVMQGVSAFNYELGVAMGAQEPAETVSEVGVAFWKGFAVADIATYIPLLMLGLLGSLLGRAWGRVALAAALGITIYWPVVCLVTIVQARGAEGWSVTEQTAYWITLPLIALWGVWGLWRLLRS